MAYVRNELVEQVAKHGFRVPRGGIAKSSREAISIAGEVGYPVALKIVSPDIPHKTEIGGVALDCRTADQVATAYRSVTASAVEHVPEARMLGVWVQEMSVGGLEMILGLNRDPQFGPCIMFGLGGILANVLGDVSWRVLPLAAEDAREMIRELRAQVLLAGYRGSAPVSEDMLVDLLMKADALAAELGDKLESFDMNPVVVNGDDHLVLDVKMILADPIVHRTGERPADVTHLATFFDARSVAVVGASDTPGKIGNAVLRSLACHEYVGDVYPVNPGRSEILGRPAYPSLASIPGQVDLAVVTVALSAVPGILDDCRAKGVHNMVIVSGGGKELGGEGQEIEAEIKRRGVASGVRIVGCNCIGVFDGGSRLDTFFQIHERMARPGKGPIAMITQSGTVGAAFLEELQDIGISRFVSYGNRIDVDEADLLTWLADDDQTKVVVCYVEGLDDGRRFLAAARRASARKPVVVYKAGRTRSAASAAASHTGFLGGSYATAAGAFVQAGLIAVDSFEELCATARSLASQPRAAGPRVALISNGAGTMVQCLDLAGYFGLELAELQPDTQRLLASSYPDYYQVHNPVDITGSASSHDYAVGIEALLTDRGIDIVMPWFVFQDTPLDEGIVEVLGELSATATKPIVCGATGGEHTHRMASAIALQGVPVHRSVREWVAAARALVPPRRHSRTCSAPVDSQDQDSTHGDAR
jgi:3-hydroxypropionyl-CoA synthetase (ADP-forming)